MNGKIRSFRHSLLTKVFITVSLTLLLGIGGWSWFNLRYQKNSMMEYIVSGADRMSTTIRLASHYAMLHNIRDDIRQIIKNVSRQHDVESVRIYDKSGRIQFSSHFREVGQTTNIKAEACDACHRETPPRTRISINERVRTFTTTSGKRMLGILSPIYNEPSCSEPACHFHPEDKVVLGALDVVMSLEDAQASLAKFERNTYALGTLVFLITAYTILLFVLRFVREPVRHLIRGTRLIAQGKQIPLDELDESDEMGELVRAINRMGRDITRKQEELNLQRDEYQNLFDNVPCLITVQDRNYRLLQYNGEFARRFAPRDGDFCFHAYKGRDCKCEQCPVEGTFRDGQPRFSEERGFNKDGTEAYWLVHTQPIRNEKGEVVAAMEMCLDITQRRVLEKQLLASERKYHAIFSNIPNPVFVLDEATLEIQDCNDQVQPVYGYSCEELCGTSFADLFADGDNDEFLDRLRQGRGVNQAKHVTKSGKHIFTDIMVARSEFSGQTVLLAITRDITHRLETEQQLIQASKMATLGEMSTGVAHELNQPLSVIRTISGFFMRKLRRKETMDDKTFEQMAQGIDDNVERAAKIIEHMREFGHKSDLKLEKVHVNTVMEKAFDIFNQQFKVRNIETRWELADDLPAILAEPNRLEQVIINLLINARDAMEEQREHHPDSSRADTVTLTTRSENKRVIVEVADTGTGFSDTVADKLFEPFFTTKEVGKGTGLGLSISYGIIKDYGGKIRARVNEQGGATFILDFPAADKNDPTPDWT